jgi:23S rRNA (guanosine2251-2'-O)-methyltransferase
MYKASSGSIEYTNIFKVTNINSTLKFLREKNFWVYGFSSDGNEDFTNYDWKGNNILLFGSEGHGLKEKTSKYIDYPVKIKINEKIESLNIANSASVVFFHINKAKKNLD